MNDETRTNFDTVIRWLMNYCMDNQIGVVYSPDLPDKAKSRSYEFPSDLVVVNANWKPKSEVPFIMAHEIGHVIEGNTQYYHMAFLGMNRGEYSANKFAINLLSLYCKENDIQFNSIYDFAKNFGIPKDKWYLLEEV